MLRSLLIGLDTAPSGIVALDLAVDWAERYGASLFGITIVDDPGIAICAAHNSGAEAEPSLPVAGEAILPLRQVVRESVRRCEEAGVRFSVREETGTPHVRIVEEAQRHDVILLGATSRFDFGWEGEPGQTLFRVLKDAPRPVVAVPEAKPRGDAVVIAYDSSLQASLALFAFVASGLACGRKLHVVTVASTRTQAVAHGERAAAFLSAHDLPASLDPQSGTGPPGEILLKRAEQLDAGLMVMGAYGQPSLREFAFGSVTRTALRRSLVPLFLFH